MIYKLKITTLTPVHIGSGIKYPIGLEAIYDKNTQSVGIIKPEKILDIIGEENLQRWMSIIEQRQDVFDFVKRFKPELKIQDISSRVVKATTSSVRFRKDFKEQLHSAGNPIIPGSSIKGAIRTAILSELIYQNPRPAQRLIGRLRDKVFFKRWTSRDLNRLANDITNSYFVGEPKQDANRDVMRFLQITDAFFDKTIATLTQTLNLKRNGWELDQQIEQVTEVIAEQQQTTIRVKINTELLEKNQNKSTLKAKTDYLTTLEVFFKLINTHTSNLIGNEIALWNEELQDKPSPANNFIEKYLEYLQKIDTELGSLSSNQAILRLGGNSGWTFITGGWAKYNGDLFTDDEWNHIYHLLNKNRDTEYFPKTRKLDYYGKPMGFVKLEFTD